MYFDYSHKGFITYWRGRLTGICDDNDPCIFLSVFKNCLWLQSVLKFIEDSSSYAVEAEPNTWLCWWIVNTGEAEEQEKPHF